MPNSKMGVDDSFMLQQLVELTEALQARTTPLCGVFQESKSGRYGGSRQGLSDQLVSELAERRAMGESYSALAADLNRRGMRSARGTRWYMTTVRDLLEYKYQKGLSC